MLFKWWAIVYDAGPPFKQHQVGGLCLLGKLGVDNYIRPTFQAPSRSGSFLIFLSVCRSE